MRDFRDCSPAEGVERIAVLLSRLTLVADPQSEPPLAALLATADAVNAGDTLLALRCYHALCAALRCAPARRVSGDLWVDYLLSLAIERPHAFAQMAAEGRLDEPERLAMRADLAILGELAGLGSDMLRRMIAERHRELQLKPRHARDNISLMSSAVWSGGSIRPAPADSARPAAPQEGAASPLLGAFPPEGEWLPWHYGEMELRDAYASDETLEEVYIRLLKTNDWRSLCDDFWNFFAAYGCGQFLKDRMFHVKQGALAPLPARQGMFCAFPCHERERGALTEHGIRFMRGESVEPLLITGPAGTGKTTLALNLPDELPELRLVLAERGEAFDADALLAALGAQPLRFLLLLDDVRFSGDGPAQALFTRAARGALPANVLLAATAREVEPAAPSAVTLRLSYPKVADFAEMVNALLAAAGTYADPAAVRNACVDYQVDARERLTVAAAVSIAKKLG